MIRLLVIFKILLIAILLTSCSKKTVTTVTPAYKVSQLSSKGLIYSLPKTCFQVKVEAIHTSVIPGPYSQFAEKYLGIANVPTAPKNQWEIASINVYPYLQPDLNALFVIEPAEGFIFDFLHLTKEGLIIPVGSALFESTGQVAKLSKSPFHEPSYHDLSTTPFIAAERTTHYSRVLQDSVFIRVPVHKTIVVEKSLEDKAREAADFIFLLRKRRFELIAGDADFVVEGKAVETVLNEITRLENEYLSLFIGKQNQTNSFYWYDFAPDADTEETSILFRFSSTKGVVPASDLSGSPVLLSFSKQNSWQGLDLLKNLAIEKDLPRNDLIYYRLPVPARIRIYNAQIEFFSKTMTLYQLGPVVRLPSDIKFSE